MSQSLLVAATLLLVPTVFYTGTRDPFLIKETLAHSLIVMAAMLWLADIVTRKRSGIVPSLLVPFCAYLFAILLSLKNASHGPLVWQHFFWSLLLFLFYWVSTTLSKRHLNRAFMAVTWASLLSGLYGAVQFFGVDVMDWSTVWGGRPSSTFGNPNFAAGWWVMTLPLFLSRTLTEKSAGRWLWAALSILTALNLYWGRTRGAWAACALAVLIACALWFYTRSPRTRATNIILSAGLAAVLILGGLTAVHKVRNARDPSVIERAFKWTTAMAMVRDHPVFGVGARNLKVQFAFYQAGTKQHPLFKDKISFRATSESNVHSEYFQIWAELGTFGLGAFLSIFCVWFRRLWGRLPGGTNEEKITTLGVTAAVTGFLLYSLTNFPLSIVPNACLIVYLLAASEAPQRETASFPVKAPPIPRAASVLGALAVFLILFWNQILPPFRADALRRRAGAAFASSDFSSAIGLYEKAIALDYYRSERTAYYLGECYRLTGQLEKAIRAYSVSLDLRNYGEVYNNIGNCYYLLKQREEAARNWKIAVRLGLPDPAAQEQTEKNLELIGKDTGGQES